MKNKKWIAGGLVCLCACIAHAGVIAAWDFEGGLSPASTAGWTSFTSAVSGALPSSTVHFTGDEYAGDGNITLNQKDYARLGHADKNSDGTTYSVAHPLLAAGNDEMDDGIKIDSQTIGFELSGLDAGQTYRIQFLGVVLDKKEIRDIEMSIGTTTVELFNHTLNGSTDVYQGGYSPVVTYTADATGTVNVDFTQNTRGKTSISGLIVETVANPNGTASVAKTAPTAPKTKTAVKPAPVPKEVKPVAKTAPAPTQPIAKTTPVAPKKIESVAKKAEATPTTFGLFLITPILLLLFRRT